MKYLAIDYGSTYLGFAMGDDDSKLAVPFDTHKEKDLDRQLALVQQIVLEEDVDVVAGFDRIVGREYLRELAHALDAFVGRDDAARVLELAHDRVERAVPVVRRALVEQPHMRLTAGALAQRGGDSRLPDPGFALEEHVQPEDEVLLQHSHSCVERGLQTIQNVFDRKPEGPGAEPL